MILITMGDPAGVGPEVLLKSLSSVRAALTVIGDLRHLRRLARRLGMAVPWRRFEWIDLGDLASGVRPGRVQAKAGRAAFACLEKAVWILKAGQALGLVTGPVSKEAIARAGIPWRGHTEYLAERFRSQATMMFVTGRFRVSLVTTHWAIREVPRRLRKAEVLRTLRATEQALRSDFGIPRPRIGLAALNPHAGEGGLFGREEKEILLPAVRASTGSARTVRTRSAHPELVEGWRIEGPLPADSLLQAAARGEYDAVVALYHDQALIPIKLIGWDQAVNVTLGLPFVRTSPVHGTAFDLAGQGRADPASMRAALRLALELASRRAHARAGRPPAAPGRPACGRGGLGGVG